MSKETAKSLHFTASALIDTSFMVVSMVAMRRVHARGVWPLGTELVLAFLVWSLMPAVILHIRQKRSESGEGES